MYTCNSASRQIASVVGDGAVNAFASRRCRGSRRQARSARKIPRRLDDRVQLYDLLSRSSRSSRAQRDLGDTGCAGPASESVTRRRAERFTTMSCAALTLVSKLQHTKTTTLLTPPPARTAAAACAAAPRNCCPRSASARSRRRAVHADPFHVVDLLAEIGLDQHRPVDQRAGRDLRNRNPPHADVEPGGPAELALQRSTRSPPGRTVASLTS